MDNKIPELELVIWPDKTLKTPVAPLPDKDFGTRIVKNVAGAMIKAMYKYSGVGLSAQQVGVPFQIFVMDTEWVKEGGRKKARIFINPRVVAVGERAQQLQAPGEGCLSFPYEYRKPVVRLDKLELEWQDLSGEKHRQWFEGFEAITAQHECLSGQDIIQTENGPKLMSELVNTKYSGRVYCLNKENKLVLSPVIGWQKKRNEENKKWVRVKFSQTGPNKQLVCTEDHPCAVIENILTTPCISYQPAGNLSNKYIARFCTNRQRNNENPLYNSDQISIIVGGLLGDACIDSRGEIIISHGEPQQEYARYKADLLNGTVKRGYSGFRDEFSNYVVRAKITEQTKLLRKMFYTESYSIKNILPYINELALAIWYQDDGTLIRSKVAQFHTEAYPKNELESLQVYLQNKFNIKVRICNRKVRGKIMHTLSLNTENSNRLFSLIAPYIHNSMQYKLPIEYHNYIKKPINSKTLDFSAKLVTKVAPIFHESCLYDIEVKNYHNFFANGTLVHNCDHLLGRLFIDRLSPMQRDLAIRRAKKIRRRYKKGYKTALSRMKNAPRTFEYNLKRQQAFEAGVREGRQNAV